MGGEAEEGEADRRWSRDSLGGNEGVQSRVTVAVSSLLMMKAVQILFSVLQLKGRHRLFVSSVNGLPSAKFPPPLRSAPFHSLTRTHTHTLFTPLCVPTLLVFLLFLLLLSFVLVFFLRCWIEARYCGAVRGAEMFVGSGAAFHCGGRGALTTARQSRRAAGFGFCRRQMVARKVKGKLCL